MSDSFRRRLFLFKPEGTYGTDSGPTAAANAVLFMDGAVDYVTSPIERQLDRGYYGANPTVQVGKQIQITGMTDLLGAATVGDAAPTSALLRACGFGETLVATTSATYAPVTDGMASASARFHHNRDLVSGRGFRGNVELMFDIKNFARAQWTLLGLPPASGNAVTDAALPPPTLTAWRDPPAIETESFEVSLDSFDLDAVGVTVNMNNQVTVYEGSESRQVIIIERAPTITIRAFNPGVAAKDYFAAAIAGTRMPLSFAVDAGASNIITVTSPQVQLSRTPQKIDIDGRTGIQLEGRMLPNTGNDEISIAFT